MGYSKSREERLLEQLLAKNTQVELNTDNLELSVGGKYDTGSRGLSNGDVVPVSINASGETIVALSATDNAVLDNLTTIDADTGAMVTDLAAMEVLLTAIDADTNAIKTDIAALEVLSTAANVDLAAIEVLSTAANVDLAAIEVTQNRMVAPTSTVYLSGTKAFTGPFYAITALTDTVIDVSEGNTNIIESDDSGSMQATATNITLPAGISIYGNFALVELDSGTAIGYAGAGITVTVAGS